MTYIDYINQFWKMNRSVEFSPNEVFLYFYLLNECNIRGWQNPFEHPNKTIVLATGISEKTVIEVRNRLQQKGLITFESGKKNAKSPVYYLLDESKTVSKEVSKEVSKRVSKTRSLGVLQQQGLVTLKGEVDATKATVNDIASNPKNLKIKTIDAAQLARSLDTVDVALVPGNYSWAADLKPADALAMEKQDDGVIEVFVVRTQDVDSDFGKAAKKLLVSQKFKDAIAKSEFKDFGKPTTW